MTYSPFPRSVVTLLLLSLSMNAVIPRAYALGDCREEIEKRQHEILAKQAALSELQTSLENARKLKTGAIVVGVGIGGYGLITSLVGGVFTMIRGDARINREGAILILKGVAFMAGGGVLIYMSELHLKKIKAAITRNGQALEQESRMLKEEIAACTNE